MDAILNLRLEAVKRHLLTTNRSILAIGTDCGFGNADYLKRLFKKRFGLSMRAYRRQASAARADPSVSGSRPARRDDPSE